MSHWASFGCDNFSDVCFFWISWQSWELLIRYFVECPQRRGLLGAWAQTGASGAHTLTLPTHTLQCLTHTRTVIHAHTQTYPMYTHALHTTHTCTLAHMGTPVPWAHCRLCVHDLACTHECTYPEASNSFSFLRKMKVTKSHCIADCTSQHFSNLNISFLNYIGRCIKCVALSWVCHLRWNKMLLLSLILSGALFVLVS